MKCGRGGSTHFPVDERFRQLCFLYKKHLEFDEITQKVEKRQIRHNFESVLLLFLVESRYLELAEPSDEDLFFYQHIRPLFYEWS